MRSSGEAMHCCSGSDLDASRPSAAGPAAARRRERSKRQCQVLGCTADLDADRHYCWKKRICSLHIGADAVTRKNRPHHLQWRYCFQCGKLELVTAFEGTHRSCRESLIRRKQGQAAKPAGAASQRQQQRRPKQEEESRSCCTTLPKQHSDAASASLAAEAPLPAAPAAWAVNGLLQQQPEAPGALAGSCSDLGGSWASSPAGSAGAAGACQEDEAYYARVLDALLMQMAADGGESAGPQLCVPAAPSGLEAAAAGTDQEALQAEQLAQLIEDELRAACLPQPCSSADRAWTQHLSAGTAAAPAAPATAAQLRRELSTASAHSSHAAARPWPLAAQQLQLQGQLAAGLAASIAAGGSRWHAGVGAAGMRTPAGLPGVEAVVLHGQVAQLQQQLQELEQLYVQVVAGLVQ